MLPRKRKNCFPLHCFLLQRSFQQNKTTHPFHGNTLMGFLCTVVEIENTSHCCEQHESIKHLLNYANQMHNIYSLHTFTVLLLLCIRLVCMYNKRARGGVVVKALRYKPEGRGFDSRWCHWNFSVA